MESMTVAKKPESRQTTAAPAPGSGVKQTTWKASPAAAKVLRKIQAHIGGNQEYVLDQFLANFDDYLAILQAKDEADRKSRADD